MIDLNFVLFFPGSGLYLIYDEKKKETAVTKEIGMASVFSASDAVTIQGAIQLPALIVLLNPNQKTMNNKENTPAETSTENKETTENTNKTPEINTGNENVTDVVAETETTETVEETKTTTEAVAPLEVVKNETTEPVLTDDVLEEKAKQEAIAHLKEGTEVEYQLKPQDVEKHNLHGGKKIRAFIKTLSFPSAELQINVFGSAGETKLDIGTATFSQIKKEPGTFSMF